jgi:small conductance mechanosensitive channel
MELESVYATIEEQTRNVIDSLTGLLIASIEVVIAVAIARLLQVLLRRLLLKRLESPNLSESGRALITVLSSIVVGMVTVTILFAHWGVTWTGLLTAISLGTLGIILGVQDVLKSLIGGIFIVLERPYAIGDRVKMRDITGRIIGIELRTTILRSDTGHRIVAPNSIVFTDTITNFSLRRHVRTTLVIAGFKGPSDEIRAAIEGAFRELEGVETEPEIRFMSHRSSIPHRIRKSLDGTPLSSVVTPRGSEVWVSWSGGGEAEV